MGRNTSPLLSCVSWRRPGLSIWQIKFANDSHGLVPASPVAARLRVAPRQCVDIGNGCASLCGVAVSYYLQSCGKIGRNSKRLVSAGFIGDTTRPATQGHRGTSPRQRSDDDGPPALVCETTSPYPSILPADVANSPRRRCPDFVDARLSRFSCVFHSVHAHLQPRVSTAHRFRRVMLGEGSLGYHATVAIPTNSSVQGL